MNNADNQDIEKKLAEKMNSLASSVDCFDEISSRAYNSNDAFFENGETVSELENVTGKKNGRSLIKICAGAAAALLLFTTIPKLPFYDTNMSDFSSESPEFRSLIEKANFEIENNEYISYDIPLSYYYNNALMITPLFDCPFSWDNEKDSNVRLYIRTVNNTPTNQMFAFEYTGTYTEDSIIAAAETSVEISDSDIDGLGIPAQIQNIKQTDDLTAASVFCSGNPDQLTDNSGNSVTLASIDHQMLYKSGTKLFPVRSLILYGTEKSSGKKFYDINTICRDHSDLSNDHSWTRSVYSNGYSAAPVSSGSVYEKRELFSKADEISENEFAFISINNDLSNTTPGLTSFNCSMIDTDDSDFRNFGDIPLPLCRSKLKIYFPSSPLEKNTELRIKLSGNNGSDIIYSTAPDSIFFNDIFYSNRLDAISDLLYRCKAKLADASLSQTALDDYRKMYDELNRLYDAANDARNKSMNLYSKDQSSADNSQSHSISAVIRIIQNFKSYNLPIPR